MNRLVCRLSRKGMMKRWIGGARLRPNCEATMRLRVTSVLA